MFTKLVQVSKQQRRCGRHTTTAVATQGGYESFLDSMVVQNINFSLDEMFEYVQRILKTENIQIVQPKPHNTNFFVIVNTQSLEAIHVIHNGYVAHVQYREGQLFSSPFVEKFLGPWGKILKLEDLTTFIEKIQ